MSERELLQMIYNLCQQSDYREGTLADQIDSLIRYHTDIGPNGYDILDLEAAYRRLGIAPPK